MGLIETSATLIKKEELSPDTKLLTFKLAKELPFTPGQFVMLNIDPADKKLTRAFSIASIPNEENTMDFCVKILPNGAVSSRLGTLLPQAKVFLKGPYGPFSIRSTEKEIVFIAAGTGIAPIRSMLQYLAQKQTTAPMWLFYRFKNQQDFLFKEELQKLKNSLPQLQVISSVSNHDGKCNHEKERIQHIIANYIKDSSQKDVYLCGPPKMVKETIEALVTLGFDKACLYKEAW